MVVAKLQESQQRFASMALPASCERMVGAFVTDACTPRVPEKEWFWWCKWLHWQVLDKKGHVVYGRISLLGRPGFHDGCECHTTPIWMCWVLQYNELVPLELDNHLVLPVTEFGPTIPVGWQVVEG